MADVIFITHFILLLTFNLIAGDSADLLDDGSDADETPKPSISELGGSAGGPRGRLKCHICDPPECENPQLCHNATTCWKSRVREQDGVESISRGCITDVDKISLCSKNFTKRITSALESENNKKRHVANGPQYFVDCCQTDLCNEGPFPVLEEIKTDGDSESYVLKLTLAILGPLAVLGVVSGVLYCLISSKGRRKRQNNAPRQNKLLVDTDIEPSMLQFSFPSQNSTSGYHPHELRATAAGDSTLKEYLDGRSLTSGSGSGLPVLTQRTLAKQVALVECLGSGGGNFGGEVWRGIWHGESVAVKIYFSRDEAAWARETEVYSQLLPSRHDNILGYVGSDMTSRASCTQLWLVTHYHPLGSLYDTLNSPETLTHHQAMTVCLSIVNGLLYLHTEIHGTRGKPAMAHRNLKSKNLLLKTNGSCVIADFSLAVTQDRLDNDRVDLRQGSRRYASPEILEQTLSTTCLESFRCADIYSLGLIMWEVCRICVSNGIASDYSAPYSEWLANANQEPTVEEMKKLVCLDQLRPPIPNRWHSDETLVEMGKLIKECWHANPAARLPILRVKKTLLKLVANDPRIHIPLD